MSGTSVIDEGPRRTESAGLRERAWARGRTLLAALLVLGALNWAWAGKAWILAQGREVRVPLAPIDPRSLLQGDYMALRFALAEQIENARLQGWASADAAAVHAGGFGRAPVRVDAAGVVELDWGNPSPELSLRYRLRQGRVWLGTNAFFFEEGEVARYRDARFGVFRVDAGSGEAVLVGLADAEGRRL